MSARLRKKRTLLCPKVQRVVAFLESNYSRGLKLSQSAALVGMHPAYLSKKFKEEVGLSFHEYLARTRIKRAVYLLAYTLKSIKEISYELGYTRPEILTKAFTQRIGCPPSTFRRNLGKN